MSDREKFTAYGEAVLTPDRNRNRVDYIVRVYSYQPISYSWEGKEFAEWPEGVPQNVYPDFPVNGSRQQIAEWREICNKIGRSGPQANSLLKTVEGYVESETLELAEAEARKTAKKVIDSILENYRRA